MKRIPLGKGKYAIVDESDYSHLITYNWTYNKMGYAVNSKLGFLHRYLLGLKKGDGKLVDHENGNGLDNRRENLRVCSKSENQCNQKNRRHSRYSKFKGVGKRSKRSGPKEWRARISFEGKTENIGYFYTEIEAAKAYDKRAIELQGKFSKLNFPNETE